MTNRSSPETDGPCQNTDREIWRGPDEGGGDAYADSLHITREGSLGINCGGSVYVKPIRDWHRLASAALALAEQSRIRAQPSPESGVPYEDPEFVKPASPENAIEWIARSTAPLHAALKKYPDAFEALHFLFKEMNHPRAPAQCAAIDACIGEPVAWRWQVYGIWHYTGGYPVSGAEPLYLRPTGASND